MPLLQTPAIVKVGSRADREKSPSRYEQSLQRKRLNHLASIAAERHVTYGIEKQLKVTIRFTEKTDENETPGSVYYKDDEKRFSQQHTLKLKTLTEYDVKIEVEPAQEITYVMLAGRKFDKVKPTNNPKEEGKSLYNIVWSTKAMKTTDRKFRTVLPVIIKFKPYKELKFQLLVKFYMNKDVAHYTGETLHFLNLDCKVGSGKDKSTHLYPPIRFN